MSPLLHRSLPAACDHRHLLRVCHIITKLLTSASPAKAATSSVAFDLCRAIVSAQGAVLAAKAVSKYKSYVHLSISSALLRCVPSP
jgi:hypothetical protein